MQLSIEIEPHQSKTVVPTVGVDAAQTQAHLPIARNQDAHRGSLLVEADAADQVLAKAFRDHGSFDFTWPDEDSPLEVGFHHLIPGSRTRQQAGAATRKFYLISDSKLACRVNTRA